MKIAFTIDDLPRWPHSELPDGYTAEGIVEDIITAQERNGIKGIYAFSNSWSLESHPEDALLLDAWLEAGNHVANHTHTHPELHDVSATTYMEEIDRAEALLDPWLRRAPRKFFRYTLNYWGDTQEKMANVKAHLDANDYTVAEVTTFLYEWDWGRAFRAALLAGDKELKAQLKDEFLDFAVAQLKYDARCAESWFGHEVLGVTLGHFIPFFAEVADAFFARLRAEGVEFIPLEEAVEDSANDAVCSVVSDKFLPYQQKLAHDAGRPMSVIVPDFQQTYDRVDHLGAGQPE